MGKGQRLYQKAKQIIPGGTQLLSKRPELHLPDYWPAYYRQAKGCEVWDLDGRKYLDCSFMAIGSAVLGYADPEVDRAVKQAIDQGVVSTLNSPLELELAQRLLKLHPWAEMARFCGGGGEAMAIAVRIARAASGRDKILFCGYHGWHDWYLAANLADDQALDGHLLPGLQPQGVPRVLKGTAIPFGYNDTQTFLDLTKKHRGEVGVVVLEAMREHEPTKEFLTTIRKITKKEGIVLVIDEVSAGFRLTCGGAHLVLGIEPDIAVFAKAMGNGYAIGAVIGKRRYMDIAQESFISSTNWTTNVGFAAAIATIKKYQKNHVEKHLYRIGSKVADGWSKLAAKHRLKIQVSPFYPIGHFSFEYKKPLVLKTLFTQEMLKHGFLATTAFYCSFAHKDKHIDAYLRAVDKVFALIAKALKEGRPKKYLKGPVAHAGFARLT